MHSRNKSEFTTEFVAYLKEFFNEQSNLYFKVLILSADKKNLDKIKISKSLGGN